jgi:hypothetical protein
MFANLNSITRLFSDVSELSSEFELSLNDKDDMRFAISSSIGARVNRSVREPLQ